VRLRPRQPMHFGIRTMRRRKLTGMGSTRRTVSRKRRVRSPELVKARRRSVIRSVSIRVAPAASGPLTDGLSSTKHT
jgi:hypothetical protein